MSFEALIKFFLEDNIYVRVVPVETAGCYVPGGLYGYTMAAVMTAGVARAAGVKK